MLSLGQKVTALATILFLEAVAFVFFPVVGVIGLCFAVPMAVLIVKR